MSKIHPLGVIAAGAAGIATYNLLNKYSALLPGFLGEGSDNDFGEQLGYAIRRYQDFWLNQRDPWDYGYKNILTMSDLAIKAGVSRSTLYKAMYGQNISMQSARKIARALEFGTKPMYKELKTPGF